MAGAPIGSGIMSIISLLGGGAAGYAAQRQQNVENEQKKSILDLHKQEFDLSKQKQGADLFQRGLQLNPDGTTAYRQDYLMDDPYNPGHQMSGQETAATLSARAAGADTKTFNPSEMYPTLGLPNKPMSASLAPSVLSLAQMKQAQDILDRMYGSKNPNPAAGPDALRSGAKLGMPPSTVGAVQATPGPAGQVNAGATRPMKYSELSPEEIFALKSNPYTAPLVDSLKGQEEMGLQKNRDTREAGNQAAHLTIAQRNADRQANNDTVKNQTDLIKTVNNEFDKKAHVSSKSLETLQKALNLADKNPEGAFAGIQGALAAANSERGTLGMLQFNVNKLPDFGGVSQTASDYLGNSLGIGPGGGRLTESNQRVIKDYLQTQLDQTKHDTEEYKRQAKDYARSLNKPLERAGRGLPSAELDTVASAPNNLSTAPKMNTQQMRILKQQAASAISGGKNPAAVKKRFKEMTGTDYGQ